MLRFRKTGPAIAWEGFFFSVKEAWVSEAHQVKPSSFYYQSSKSWLTGPIKWAPLPDTLRVWGYMESGHGKNFSLFMGLPAGSGLQSRAGVVSSTYRLLFQWGRVRRICYMHGDDFCLWWFATFFGPKLEGMQQMLCKINWKLLVIRSFSVPTFLLWWYLMNSWGGQLFQLLRKNFSLWRSHGHLSFVLLFSFL